MNIRVIRNHNGIGALGSTYCEGSRICEALQQSGHVTDLADPEMGLNGAARHGGLAVISTQPEKHNGALQDYFARSLSAWIAWRAGWKQVDFVEDVLEESNIGVLHLCVEKAYRLTRLMSLSDSAKAINALSPASLVLVSDPSGAAACRHGVVTKVLSQRLDEPMNRDGNGAAFFGAFLGAMLNGESLPCCLAAGHRLGAESARGAWLPISLAQIAPLTNTEPELVPCK